MTFETLVRDWTLKDRTEKEILMNHFIVKFSYHSGKIENEEFNYNDTREIFEKGSVTGFTGSVGTLIEQKNLKDSVRLMIDGSLDLSLDLIKTFHYSLLNGCLSETLVEKGEKPGEFKKGDYVVGLNDVGCSLEEVEDELSFLVKEVNEVLNFEIEPSKLLKIVCYFHAWFESIHPFADGNGRCGRMLINWMLLKFNLPPVIVFNEDKKFYYECLEQFNETEEIDSLVKFIKFETVKTWERPSRKSLRESKLFN